MEPVINKDGAIANAAVLSVDDVTHRRVVCPACAEKVFEMWPEGWDAHAAHKCGGLSGEAQEDRKAEFKASLRHLYRR